MGGDLAATVAIGDRRSRRCSCAALQLCSFASEAVGGDGDDDDAIVDADDSGEVVVVMPVW